MAFNKKRGLGRPCALMPWAGGSTCVYVHEDVPFQLSTTRLVSVASSMVWVTTESSLAHNDDRLMSRGANVVQDMCM